MTREILIVEDNRDNRLLLCDILKDLDYTVKTATDGKEALDMLSASQPDLILMDMSLPLVDGWTIVQQLRQQPQFGHTPIIALTAHAMSTDRDRAFAVGCTDFLTKPIDIALLLTKVNQFLR